MPSRLHDRAILDALEATDCAPVRGTVWRITRKGRDPLKGSSGTGRCSPGNEHEVLYMSFGKEGSLAEIGFRLSLEPIWPSRIEHEVHRIAARTERTLRFADVAALQPLGVDPRQYEGFDYTATQAIAAAAHFLEFDGLIVPSARHPSLNLVVFMDRLAPDSRLELISTEAVDWSAWRKANRR